MSSQPRNTRAPKISPNDWEPHKQRILELYLEEGLPLSVVIPSIETETGFIASEKQYQRQLRQIWKIRKNVMDNDHKAIERKTAERNGKETRIKRNGIEVFEEEIQRKKARRFLSTWEQAVQQQLRRGEVLGEEIPPTPSNMSIATPTTPGTAIASPMSIDDSDIDMYPEDGPSFDIIESLFAATHDIFKLMLPSCRKEYYLNEMKQRCAMLCQIFSRCQPYSITILGCNFDVINDILLSHGYHTEATFFRNASHYYYHYYASRPWGNPDHPRDSRIIALHDRLAEMLLHEKPGEMLKEAYSRWMLETVQS